MLTNRVLRRPTLFPLADGIGLAGEAGPEAILPLARMGLGELGVKAMLARLPAASSALRPVAIDEFNINAPGAPALPPPAPADARPPAMAMAA